jgi:hypothetical protein
MRLGKSVFAVGGVVVALQIVLMVGCSRPESLCKAAGPQAADVRCKGGEKCSCGLTPACMPAHPFMLFGSADISTVALRKARDPLMEECWTRLTALANKPDVLDAPEDDNPDARQYRDPWWSQLEARAFVGVVGGDKAMIQRAITLLQRVVNETDPVEFYDKGADNFHDHAAPLRALALAWDWLYQDMTPPQRAQILPGLEKWCDACFTLTNKQWWREASYNVGAIPIGGLGILSLAIRADSTDPRTAMWLREATRRIGENFYPTTFKPSGICWEGPNYSIVGLRYPAVFSEALRRAGGDDQLGQSGAIRTMQYQMHQWMPQGSCAPIGDNTDYGRRTFAAEYLLGLGRTRDATGLWTWRNYTNTRSVDPLITYVWYPLDLKPVSPAGAKAPSAKYFEMTENRAGYFFSRTKWQDEDAAFFSFVTRYERCNHEHYDMNSFLLGAFGTLFATHEMLFPYGHNNHGVDFEHNMIIVDEGGWPKHDSNGSCGDDNSTEGLLMGLATGPFADYMRGDAKWSYRDNSIIIDNPAIRAERAFLFVKAGNTPYMVSFDDIQFSDDPHAYRWQWYAPADVNISGAGTTGDPLLLAAKKGSCVLSFIGPDAPVVKVGKIQNVARSGGGRRRGGASQPASAPASQAAAGQVAGAASRPAASRPVRSERFLQRIDAIQEGIRVRYAAVATLQLNAADRPLVKAEAVTCESPSAGGAIVRLADGSIDQLVWQSEEAYQQRGSALTSGELQTDGLMAMVRVKGDRVTGYVLGEGTYLKWGNKVLVQAKDSVCVTADKDGVNVSGRRQARKSLPTVEPVGVRTFRPAAN